MYCIRLASAIDQIQVGGKAANLSRVATLGLRIPDGFVIARSGLTCFLRENGLGEPVRDYVERDWGARADRQRQYEELCARIVAAPIPEPLRIEIRAATEKLLAAAPVGLAVRSSGIHEDTPEASFAGAFESFLGISTLEALWDAIRGCWCSAWAPQVLDYARVHAIVIEPDPMAVIVQETIPADNAGVLFTADPLTGNPWRFVLNSGWGLAQSVVDGSAPADAFVLEWDTGRILETRLAEKPSALVADRQGVHQVALSGDRKEAASLSEPMISRLGRMALQVDRTFGLRVDIEWAAVGDDLYVVQARPITALPGFFPCELSEPDAQLTWTLSDPLWFTSVEEGGHIVAPLFRDRWALEQWHRLLTQGDIFPRRKGRECDFNGYRYTTEWAWETTERSPAQIEQWLIDNEEQLRQSWLSQKASVVQASRRLGDAQQDARRPADWIALLLDCLKCEDNMQAAVWAAPQWMFFTCEYLLKGFVEEAAPHFAYEKLLQGLSSYSHELTKAAQYLACSIQEEDIRDIFVQAPLDAVVSRISMCCADSSFLRDYTAFCWQFGVCPPTLAEPWSRWSKEPLPTLQVMKNALLQQGRDAGEMRAECAYDRQKWEEQLHQFVLQHHPAMMDRMKRILDWTQFWMPVLDDRSWHYVIRTRLADLMKQTGQVLTEGGLLDKPADILLLTPDDLAETIQKDDVRDNREMYLARKREYEGYRRLTPPLFLGKPPGAMPAEAKSENASQLAAAVRVFQGEGYSPGQVTGISRKIMALNDPAFLDLLTNEHILVCPKLHEWRPDWLSLFTVIRGLVTVRGVQLQHATQIARECGIPFVNLPEEDWDAIPDNAPLSLDGKAGMVTVLE